MSSYLVGPQVAHAPINRVEPTAAEPAARDGVTPDPVGECLDFVRFCYRRRRVAWPALYDEMCAVAARGAFRGLGFGDLAEHGISFCLSDLPTLAALTERVVREERTIYEPNAADAQVTINLAIPARS